MDIRQVMKTWVDGLDEGNPPTQPPLGFDMIHEEWSPKCKWFQPPMWKIFRWAYNIRRRLFTNCYPISISTSNTEVGVSMKCEEIKPAKSITLTFNAPMLHNENIDKLADDFKKRLDEIMVDPPEVEGLSEKLTEIGYNKDLVIPSMKTDRPRGANAAITYWDDPSIKICDGCPDKRIMTWVNGQCLHLKSCIRAYHMGHIDGTVENGTRIDCYRGGNREYLDGEEMLCQWKMMYNQGQE